jgi:phenylpropionate dioxygenase-like ring-hydroxylating dioxygenase large terminal subunit
MELKTNLTEQTVQNRIREVGINPNYWYAVGWSEQLKPTHTLAITIWLQSIVLYRDEKHKVYALENACPHRGVALDKGEVQGNHIICPYHGWEISEKGQCVNIPYFDSQQKLPRAGVHAYPVREKYGLIWLFPGDPNLAHTVSLPEIPEYNDPNFLMIPIDATFNAHFSICNENTMDVFHGYLHRNLQGWFNPELTKLEKTGHSVRADYRVSYQGWVIKFLNLSKGNAQVTHRTVSVQYQYPHYYNSLEGVSSLYLMRLPVTPTQSYSFSLLFVKVRLPRFLITLFQSTLRMVIRRFLFRRFLQQDIEMIESEQQNYLANPKRRYVEVNPAITALQRVMVEQYEQFESSHHSSNSNGEETGNGDFNFPSSRENTGTKEVTH